MATLVYGLNQSLDGYVDHDGFAPGPGLFNHFIEQVKEQAGAVYGRRMYEIMRYWDEDQPGWDSAEQAYAEAWRAMPKWVASRTLKSVGPNATLLEGDLKTAIQAVKDACEGELELAGPNLAESVSDLGVIDAYRIYLHPVVLGQGTPYFAGPRPRLRLTGYELMGEDVIRLTYAPA